MTPQSPTPSERLSAAVRRRLDQLPYTDKELRDRTKMKQANFDNIKWGRRDSFRRTSLVQMDLTIGWEPGSAGDVFDGVAEPRVDHSADLRPIPKGGRVVHDGEFTIVTHAGDERSDARIIADHRESGPELSTTSLDKCRRCALRSVGTQEGALCRVHGSW